MTCAALSWRTRHWPAEPTRNLLTSLSCVGPQVHPLKRAQRTWVTVAPAPSVLGGRVFSAPLRSGGPRGRWRRICVYGCRIGRANRRRTCLLSRTSVPLRGRFGHPKGADTDGHLSVFDLAAWLQGLRSLTKCCRIVIETGVPLKAGLRRYPRTRSGSYRRGKFPKRPSSFRSASSPVSESLKPGDTCNVAPPKHLKSK